VTRHGHYSCYIKGCRRPECCEARYRYNKQYELRRRQTGGRTTVDAKDCAQRLRQLHRAGHSYPVIAQASGLDRRSLQAIADGKSKRVQLRTERQILALTASDCRVVTRGYLPSSPTYALVDELVKAGWSRYWVQQRIGWPQGELRPRVWRSTHARVQALHDELWTANAEGTRPLREVCRCHGSLEPHLVKDRERSRAYRARKREEAA
jgi:hypothetical protein